MRRDYDAIIVGLANRQRGYVERRQLIARGVPANAIDRRIARGMLIVVYPGVYAVGHVPQLIEDRAMAAILAGGDGAALAHWSAAPLWNIVEHLRLPFHIVVKQDRRPRGIVVHRAQLRLYTDITTQKGLRCTSPARTLLDLAVELHAKKRLVRAVNNVQHQGWMKRAALIDVLERFPRHPGAKLLRPLAYDEDGITESAFEDAFRPFHAKYDLPPVSYGVWIAGKRADAYFPAERVIVECDSWEFHRFKSEFVGDRLRDLKHKALDYLPVRITWGMLLDTPDWLAEHLHTILARRRRELASRVDQ